MMNRVSWIQNSEVSEDSHQAAMFLHYNMYVWKKKRSRVDQILMGYFLLFYTKSNSTMLLQPAERASVGIAIAWL
jgi:hypothetical protein